jgi:hypothetical protein
VSAAVDGDPRAEGERATEHETRHRGREHPARNVETRSAQDDPYPDRDDGEWPEPKPVGKARLIDAVDIGGHEDRADRDEEDSPVQEFAVQPHRFHIPPAVTVGR